MIIRCENCSTTFRLPDEKIKPEGTRVRCSRCKNVFTVYPQRKEIPEEIPEFEEKTRIAFISSPFGEDKEDEGPITIKRHVQEIGPSIETLGHGIPLTSPEIKKIEEPSKDLNEIMAALSEGLKIPGAPQKDNFQDGDIPASAPPEAIPAQPSQQSVSNDIDSLLENLSDIQPEVKAEKREEAPEDLPDLSALLSAIPSPPSTPQTQIEEQKEELPDLSAILSPPPPPKDQPIGQVATPSIQPETSPQPQKAEDKLSLDIDKAFDSLFSDQPAVEKIDSPPVPEQPQPRKTMLYMEAVPVAPPNQPAQTNTQVPPNFETLELGGLPNPPSYQPSIEPQIQDSLISDDLSMFLSPQPAKNQPVNPPTPTLNISDDLLNDLSVPPVETPKGFNETKNNMAPPLGNDLSLSFGDLGEISGNISSSKDEGRFSTTMDRSSDLMDQMDSIGSIPTPSPSIISSGSVKPTDEIKLNGGNDISIPTVSEVKAEKKSQPTASIKPPTIALKTTEKSLKSEIFRWMFTILLAGFVVLNVMTPSITFPEVKDDIIHLLRTPFVDNSVMIDNLYYRKINDRDTLLIFVGKIHLVKAVSPEEIMIRFRITDLGGTEITQIEYPLTDTEDFNSVKNINTAEDIKRFLKDNKLKIITHRTSRFIAPLILTNIDLNRVDIKTDLITISR